MLYTCQNDHYTKADFANGKLPKWLNCPNERLSQRDKFPKIKCSRAVSPRNVCQVQKKF